jgi:hypothetical protein
LVPMYSMLKGFPRCPFWRITHLNRQIAKPCGSTSKLGTLLRWRSMSVALT